MSASGVNVRTPRTDHALWKAALAGLAIPLRRGVLGVRPEAWIVIPIAMPDFVLDDVGTVHSPHVGVRASLSVELTIF
jgi:hypothetical protein